MKMPISQFLDFWLSFFYFELSFSDFFVKKNTVPLKMVPKAGPVTGTFACAVIPCVWEVIESSAGGTTLFHTSVQIGGIRSILA